MRVSGVFGDERTVWVQYWVRLGLGQMGTNCELYAAVKTKNIYKFRNKQRSIVRPSLPVCTYTRILRIKGIEMILKADVCWWQAFDLFTKFSCARMQLKFIHK